MIFHDKKSTSTLKTSLSLLFACRLGREIKAGVSLYGDKTDLFNFLNWYQVVGDNYNMTHGIIASLNFFFVCCGKWVRKTETRVNLRPEEEQITDLDQGNCISCRCSIVLWAKGGRIVRFQYWSSCKTFVPCYYGQLALLNHRELTNRCMSHYPRCHGNGSLHENFLSDILTLS